MNRKIFRKKFFYFSFVFWRFFDEFYNSFSDKELRFFLKYVKCLFCY